MSKNKYSQDVYKMYEHEYNKNILLTKEIKEVKLELATLKYEFKYKFIAIFFIIMYYRDKL